MLENLLEAVIGLPANLFFGTGIPAAIVIFHKGRKTTDVLFIDASREFQDDKPNAENQLIKEQVEEDLLQLIEELPEDQQTVLRMRMYRDMSFKEIAENTGVSINTALGRMRYALINLRKLIEQNNIVLTN